MIDQFITSIVNTLIGQGGGWLIAVLLGIVIYIMDKRLREAQAKTENDMRDQYEKRMEEFREIMEAVGASTQSMKGLQASVTASGEATNQLTKAFAKLLREVESHKTMSKQLDAIQQNVENLHKGKAA